MSEAKHLLSTLGVLSDFCIAKKIQKKKIRDITANIKKSKKSLSKDKLTDLVNKKLEMVVKKELEHTVPPGILPPNVSSEHEKMRSNYINLYTLAITLFKNFEGNNFTKHDLCFIIHSLINLTDLNETDFEEFTEKFSEFNEKEKSEGEDGDF